MEKNRLWYVPGIMQFLFNKYMTEGLHSIQTLLLWSLAMFLEKPLLKHLKLNSEQTKQLFFESLMKYVWQLLNLGECLSHFFEISFQSVIQPFRCNRSNLVVSVGFAELKNNLIRKSSGWK